MRNPLRAIRIPIKGIFLKTFLLTVALMASCFLIEIVFQTQIISSLYQKANVQIATDTLASAKKTAKERLSKTADPSPSVISESFFYDADYPFMILDENSHLEAFPYNHLLSTLNIRTSEGDIYRIVIDPSDYPTLSFYNLVTNKTLSCYSVRLWDSDLYFPLSFSYNGGTYNSNANINQWRGSQAASLNYSEHISGVLISISNYSLTSQTHSAATALFKSMAYDYLAGDSSSDIYDRNKKVEMAPGKYVLVAERLQIDDHDHFFFTSKYIDNVALSYSLLQKYNMVLYAILLIIISLVSYYLSKRIATPLAHLDDKAQRIASLDFTESTELDSDDELGNLERSLNHIAATMDAALSNVKEMNDKLNEQVIEHAENEARIRSLLTEMSHEFKTPLNIISSAGSVLSDGIGDKDPKYYSDIIVDQSRRMSNMVNDVITLSRLESGYYFFKPRLFCINDLLQEILSNFETSPALKPNFVKRFDERMDVFADPDRISQVLVNFIGNAHKHSDPDTPIEICLERTTNDQVKVRIINQGTLGVEDTSVVWRQFYHGAPKKGSPGENGSGIGLTICAKILELHGCDYGVTDKNGEVCFYFLLPAKAPADRESSDLSILDLHS